MNSFLKTSMIGAVSAAMLAASAISMPVSAQAQDGVRADGSYDVAQNWRGGQRGWNKGPGWHRGPGWRGPGYYPRARYRGWNGPGWYGGRYYNDSGAALAAGVIGLATGAIIAGAVNNNQRYVGNDYVAYCSQRYRSFNPATGTYMGYDGRAHRCVMP